VAGREVFSADFEPAVVANPYIQLTFRAMESDPVILTWRDNDGTLLVGEDMIIMSQASKRMCNALTA
jgi:sulfur-oxidizing protein SoxZ